VKLTRIHSLGTQLGLAFASIILLLGGLALLAWGALGRSHREARSILEDRLKPVIQLYDVRAAYLSTLVRMADGVAAERLPGPESAARMVRARLEARAQWEAYKATYLVPEEVRIIPIVEGQFAAIGPLAERLEALAAAHRPGDPALANWLDFHYLPAAEALGLPLSTLIGVQEQEARELVQAMGQRQRWATWGGGIALLCAVGLASLLALRISRGLGRRASTLVQHLEALAKGDLAASTFQAEDGQWHAMAQDLDRIVLRLQAQAAAMAALEHQARVSNQAKSAFVASMSHELRTPLSAILGYARLMSREPGRGVEDERQLAHILRAGEHLLALINDVLSLSRIEAGRLEFKAVPFDPHALFLDLKSLFQLSAQGRGLAFELVTDGFPRQLEGDLPKLRQVLVNLLANAVKFTEVGHVRLLARWLEDHAEFTVEDSGPGMSGEEQDRLFQAFSQAEAGLEKGGTGLGLHISQALVGVMGGTIRVVSQKGQGSRFSFDLPLPEPEVPVSLVAAAQELRLAVGQARPLVLVVDDRFENRDILSRLLSQAGFRVTEADQGATGLEQWLALRPDLVLMDLRMPVMDGFEALTRIRQLEMAGDLPRTPVVAISASVYDVSEEALQAKGFDRYLSKPIEEGPFFATIAALLNLRLEQVASAQPRPPEDADELAALGSLDADWRDQFRDQITTGDLEAAEACLDTLGDPALSEVLRRHLRAYNLQELLDRLG
jgi:signal transduction histidine kinase/DNA-binding response OmpR family regulator